MDNHFQHLPDMASIPSASAHRMPTVSAAQALHKLQNTARRSISTGLPGLAGVERGKVTEIYGPPGVGKSMLAMQIAANALRDDAGVVWIDAAHPTHFPHLMRMLSRKDPAFKDCPSSTDMLEKLTHFNIPTLAHLLALLSHDMPNFPPPSTALLVIDSLSSLLSVTYPRHTDSNSIPRKTGPTKNDQQQWASNRKWAVIQHIVSGLQKLATLHNVAVVVPSQVVTKMQSGLGATLVPAISSTAWDAGVATRIVLYRDWGWEGREVRFAGVLKQAGVQAQRASKVVAFTIHDDHLEEVPLRAEGEPRPQPPVPIMMPPRKRKADEIRDSEDEDDDEDYGWAEADVEELPPPQSQWAGSEDILVRGPEDLEAREEEEEEGAEEEEEGADGTFPLPDDTDPS